MLRQTFRDNLSLERLVFYESNFSQASHPGFAFTPMSSRPYLVPPILVSRRRLMALDLTSPKNDPPDTNRMPDLVEQGPADSRLCQTKCSQRLWPW
jgi:hypothetical protein